MISAVDKFLQAVRLVIEGVDGLVNYYLQKFFHVKITGMGIIGLNILIIAFLGYLIMEHKSLKYLVIFMIILLIIDIVGIPAILR